jgi:hypothetical protein
LAYVFWTSSLKYTFPQTYLIPINQSFAGAFERLKLRLRIGKKETDLKKEVEIQNNINPVSNIVKHDIVDRPGNIAPENIQLDFNENNQIKSQYPFSNNLNYQDKNRNYLDKNEENLDK